MFSRTKEWLVELFDRLLLTCVGLLKVKILNDRMTWRIALLHGSPRLNGHFKTKIGYALTLYVRIIRSTHSNYLRYRGLKVLNCSLRRWLLFSQFKPTQNTEPGMLNFKVNSLQCHVYMNQHHFQSLHIKISMLSENKESWSMEDLQVISVFALPYLVPTVYLVLRLRSLLNSESNASKIRNKRFRIVV